MGLQPGPQAFLAIGVFILSSRIPTTTSAPVSKYCPSPPDTSDFSKACEEVWIHDVNNDGTIELKELFDAHDPSVVHILRVYFLYRDLNGDGVVTKADEPLWFDRFDFNHDGTVSADEIKKEGELSKAQIPFVDLSQPDYVHEGGKIYKLWKTDLEDLLQSQKTSRADFYQMWQAYEIGQPKAAIQFNYLDTNGDNVITGKELKDRFNELDTNNDGHVTVWELLALTKIYD